MERPGTPLAERILLALSRDPATSDYDARHDSRDIDHALDGLCTIWPNLLELVAGRRVLDFGCGNGFQSVALARAGAKSVVGVDINRELLAFGRRLADDASVADRVEFIEPRDRDLTDRFDIVISLDSMEHFEDPVACLTVMRGALSPEGRILVSFSPPWYAPYGAHMHFFTRLPWVHLMFRETTIMAVRSRFRDDGATRYSEVEGGLNRMSLRRFEGLLRALELTAVDAEYQAVKNIPLVTGIPLLRELLVNRVACTLVPETRNQDIQNHMPVRATATS